ncbi:MULTISPECIES: 2Fe-2S iron-sulfur cluster-binding protein [unclassified Oceanobacter]|jgi:2Fe-2S ferredoxin|uniref:2Fe-2S iron-sulfur cluster-binding protein n=1 Tax=unclassified Oceanobacter TaxID=2620260 RepID=UPI0026E1C558|nr:MULTISPECIES: 2Fe-2S iron-sulfur cluster-binding protein [unclassified Oceanobacter]MDO6680727.1 2Fe-2S iron-sulfur cluster-binding protein [Oceanobacter sp. 5_MG-2023]MDP2504495.1 2Fe-2S iron-sulfur cluster-binding protein [Oceanobacter sp. 3_MG-2023]MDP2547051.1 2Fe-2S iron-sulfur cluster-binding protein [Oceanobacter sp. 4_MG-2023]MDP2607875.1 2Fe-2S iron-sulfur cluster-binding protein [Oceanobacter sp. 1_MG-2023]MDP2610941.1 2Fe-2S iron-sulfur cluster-binding protein [Oceanobacter sp. 2
MSNATIHIGFKLPDGNIQHIDAPLGQNIMQAAIVNNIDGIEAECGGSCMCATCHLYLPDSLLDSVTPANDEELEMLEETAAERRPGSRLSCQLLATEAMAGVIFEVPECQS